MTTATISYIALVYIVHLEAVKNNMPTLGNRMVSMGWFLSKSRICAVVPDFGLSQVGRFLGKDQHDKMMEEAKVRHIISTGRACDAVLRLVATTKANLIVVGAHKADLTDDLLGPNAARVVRHAKCSVYVVRSSGAAVISNPAVVLYQ